MIAGVVNQLGVSLGQGSTLEASIVNPSGFFERQDVVEVNNEALQSLGGDWLVPPILHSDTWLDFSDQTVKNFRTKLQFLDGQGQNWLVKDPRIALLLPLWDRIALERLPVVIVVRNPLEIAQSLHLRNGLTHRQGLALWFYYMRTLSSELRVRPNIVIDYQTALSEKISAIKALAEFAHQFAALDIENLSSEVIDSAAKFMNPEFSRSSDLSEVRGIGSQDTDYLVDIYTSLQERHLGQLLEDPFSMTPDWVSEALFESRKYRKLQDDLASTQRALVETRMEINDLKRTFTS